jgi:hypothetical protein
MSNYKAISVVTAALRNRLTTVCNSVLPGATVTTLRPDAPSQSGLPTVGVNIFLYQVTPNAALRNQDLPTRRSDGGVVKHPTAALDLHYLFSFYGHDGNFESQLLLGAVVGNLHALPSLSRDEIQQVFSANALGQAGASSGATQGDQTIAEIVQQNQPALFDPSGLADAVDLVRFTTTELSLEELSKLWSVFLDTPYVLSNIYQAGPVLIEDTGATLVAAGPPVMLPAVVHAFPFPSFTPAIAQVYPSTGQNQPIFANSKLTVEGSFYAGVATTILINGQNVSSQTLPDTPRHEPQPTITGISLPTGLSVGAQSVQVQQQISTGNPNHPTRTAISNLAEFILRPTFTHSVSQFLGTRDVVLTVTPAVNAHQTVQLLLNPFDPTSSASSASAPAAFALEAPSPQQNGATSFTIPTTGLPGIAGGEIPAGTYLARIVIDGVESALDFTPPPASGSTATGQTGFTGPTITLP